MQLPTLLQKGHLTPSKESDEDLSNYIPIEYIMTFIRERVKKTGIANRTLVIRSDTASGKTTVLPPYIFKNFFKSGEGNIIITQPKILLAIKNAKEVAKIPGNEFMKLGDTIGWQTGSSKMRAREGVIFMTVGVLTIVLKLYTDEEIMKMYRFIILDEVHELSIEMSQTLYLLKKFMTRNAENPNLPFVICASATLDIDLYLRYFNLTRDNAIIVEGFAYPKTTHWLAENAQNYLDACYDRVREICAAESELNEKKDLADILVFLPGIGEIKKLAGKLDQLNVEITAGKMKCSRDHVMKILLIDSAAVASNSDDYLNLEYKASELRTMVGGKRLPTYRRVILTTNVSEVGLTIDTLRHVIDGGYNRGTEFYPSINATGLLTKPITHSRVKQRMGRAGRKFPGDFWPTYTEETFKLMEKQQYSDLILNEFSTVLLSIMATENNKFNVASLDLIEFVAPDSIHAALEKCYVLGYYSARTAMITPMGLIANLFYMVPLEISRTLLAGYFWETCELDLVTIAAYLLTDLRNFESPPPPRKVGGEFNDTADVSIESLENESNDMSVLPDLGQFYTRTDSIDTEKISTSKNIYGGDSHNKKKYYVQQGSRKPIDWIKIYREGSPKYMKSDDSILFKFKIISNDEFVNGLILYRAVCNIIKKSSNDNFYTELLRWCDECGLSFKGVMEFIKARDNLIEQMASVGLVVIDNKTSLLDQPEELFMDEFIKIKYCIYDGFCLNRLILGSDMKYHIGPNFTPEGYNTTRAQYNVITPEFLTENENSIAQNKKYGISERTLPKYLLYNKLMLKYNKTTMLYDIVAERVLSIDCLNVPISY